MNNLRTSVAKAIALVAVVSASGFAAASDSGNLVATATVSGVCKFVTVPPMAFGAIDPSTVGATGVTATSAVTYRCTTGTTAGVTPAVGPYAMVDPGVAGSTLPFTLSIPAASVGTGFAAAAQTLTITGTISQAAAQAAMAGTGYTKTVALTLTP